MRHVHLSVTMAGLLVGGLLACGSARASDAPRATIQTDGSVVVTCTVQQTEADVRDVLRDGATASRLSPDVIDVNAAQRGRCEELKVQTRGFLHPFSFRSLRCPTTTGWKETLLTSEDFERVESEWQLSPEAEGTRIVYRIASVVSAPIPQSAVVENVKRSATATMKALIAKLDE